MRDFQDSTGAKYAIALPVGEVLRVKRESDGRFNLLEPTENKLAERLVNGFEEFWELLAYLVTPQLTAAGIDAEEFGRRMEAEHVLKAQRKFIEEWTDFFQKLQRPDAALVLEKMSQYRAKAIEVLQARASDPKLKEADEVMERHLASMLNKLYGNLPGKLDSTLSAMLGDTPGDNSTA
jgi:hypothetical protein